MTNVLYICVILLKRCLLRFRLNTASPVFKPVSPKNIPGGCGILLGVSREPRLKPNCGWLAGFFLCQKYGVGR